MNATLTTVKNEITKLGFSPDGFAYAQDGWFTKGLVRVVLDVENDAVEIFTFDRIVPSCPRGPSGFGNCTGSVRFSDGVPAAVIVAAIAAF